MNRLPEHRFGVSTHLFHQSRLTRDHLVHIAAHGFETVELFATRTHFDYHDDQAIQRLREWLEDTQLELHSVHAPIVEGMANGRWVGSYSNASGDERRRAAAIAETRVALELARRIPYRYLVTHLGMPSAEQVPANDNQRDAARRSVEEISIMAAQVGVRVALEVIPNDLSAAGTLVHLIEEDMEGLDVGICLDYGHAHIMGDLGDAIESVSGHLWTTHVHDNAGQRDDHLVPFAGRINWDAAMMETQKIGYDGVLMLEVGDTGDPIDVLRRSARARERLEKIFVIF
jgi:sugar phosphate isomerase/epimerase